MSPNLIDAIGPLLAIFGIGSFILIGMKLRYTHLRETKNTPSAQEIDRLNESIELLQDHVRGLRDEMVDFSERLEFAERVLARGRADEPAGKPLLPEEP